jgi:chromosomal replication initiator protein
LVETSIDSTNREISSSETELWNDFLETFKKSIGQFQFQIFGNDLTLSDRAENSVTIQVPREFHKEWLKEKEEDNFNDAITEVYGDNTKAIVEVTDEPVSNKPKQNNSNNKENNIDKSPKFPFADSNDFNPDLTFDNFVVGDSNEYAYSAAKAISEDPVNNFNPLFIYGGVGLGKTHLLHAIGHEVNQTWEQANVKCINAEQFTNEIINAIREGNTKNFKYNYRNVDMFLVDDVQFLAKTDAAQEEFYHTFNELYEKGKGTVFCSDSPPEEISKIEERLRSRFGMGLTVDIQPPGYETRVAILQKKAEQEGLSIPADVIDFIADNLKGNVRQLERSLTQLAMKTSLSKEPITIELAREELSDLINATGNSSTKPLSIDSIQEIVADFFDLSLSDLRSKKRTRSIARPRQIAMYLAREETNNSYQNIGSSFGGRDHSTVIHAQNKISDLLDEEPDGEIARQIRQLKNKL